MYGSSCFSSFLLRITGPPTLLDQLRSTTARYQMPFSDKCAVDSTPALKRFLHCDLCQWQPPDLLQALSPFASLPPLEAMKAALSQQRTKQLSRIPKLSWFIDKLWAISGMSMRQNVPMSRVDEPMNCPIVVQWSMLRGCGRAEPEGGKSIWIDFGIPSII